MDLNENVVASSDMIPMTPIPWYSHLWIHPGVRSRTYWLASNEWNLTKVIGCHFRGYVINDCDFLPVGILSPAISDCTLSWSRLRTASKCSSQVRDWGPQAKSLHRPESCQQPWWVSLEAYLSPVDLWDDNSQDCGLSETLGQRDPSKLCPDPDPQKLWDKSVAVSH